MQPLPWLLLIVSTYITSWRIISPLRANPQMSHDKYRELPASLLVLVLSKEQGRAGWISRRPLPQRS